MVGTVFWSDDEQALKELQLSNPQRSAFGELMTAEKRFGAGWNFFTDLNTNSVSQNLIGSGSIAQASAMANLSTGATQESSVEIKTLDSVGYLNGTGVECLFTAIFGVGTTGTLAEIGIGDDLNGWFFQEKEGVFGIVRRQDGVDDFIPQASWNHDKMDGSGLSKQVLDITKGNVYKIDFQWLGFGAQNFYIEDSKTGLLTLVHRIEYANKNSTPSVFVPQLPMRAYIENGLTTNVVEFKTASSAIYTQGAQRDFGARFAAFASATLQSGERGLIQIRNKETFSGKRNYASIKVDYSGVALDSGQPAVFSIRKNSIITGASFSDIDTINSRVEVSYSNGTISGGRLLLPVPITNSGQDNTQRPDIIVAPGETIEMTIDPGINSPVIASLAWEELA